MQGLKNTIPPSKIRCYIIAFSLGAVIYPVLEIIYRSRTHFTMSILGGISGIIIYHVNRTLKSERRLTRALVCMIFITLTEFISGIFLNVILKLEVWDYSTLPYNLLGQISLIFSFIWFIIAIPALYLCDLIDKYFFPILNGNLFFINSTKEANNRGKTQKTKTE